MASADELANAVKQQDAEKKAEKKKAGAKPKPKSIREQLYDYIEKNKLNKDEIATDYKLTKESTDEEVAAAFKLIKERFGE